MMETSYSLNNKLCRICLEDGIFTSIFSSEFAISPYIMLQYLNLKIESNEFDRMPIGICNNCYYRLSLAYHFKQQCENSDIRLRQYLGIRYFDPNKRDAQTMTDYEPIPIEKAEIKEDDERMKKNRPKSRRSRYKPKLELKKRGPKPTVKVPQTCYTCHKNFKCLAQLQMHQRTHSGERPFICEYCQRRFAQKHNLAIHLRTHTGEKPFQCEICSKQFTAHGNFIAHKKIHSGVRDQICPVCSKSFITSSDLSRHLSTHTGIKSFACDVCNKSFTRNRDMVMHKRKIHLNDRSPDTVYKCIQCRKVFPSAESLQLHMVKDHVSVPLEVPPNLLEQHPMHHNIPGPHHLHPHHPHHHQALMQPPLLPPQGLAPPANFMGHHQRLHPY